MKCPLQKVTGFGVGYRRISPLLYPTLPYPVQLFLPLPSLALLYRTLLTLTSPTIFFFFCYPIMRVPFPILSNLTVPSATSPPPWLTYPTVTCTTVPSPSYHSSPYVVVPYPAIP